MLRLAGFVSTLLFEPASADAYVTCSHGDIVSIHGRVTSCRLCLDSSVPGSFCRRRTDNTLHLAGFVLTLLFGIACTDAHVVCRLGGLVSAHGACYVSQGLSQCFRSVQLLQMLTSPYGTNMLSLSGFVSKPHSDWAKCLRNVQS